MMYNKGLSIRDDQERDDVIRVSSGSDVQAVAGSIAKSMMEKDEIVIRVVGAAAVNQAVKSVAIARGYVAPTGRDMVCRIGFTNVQGRDSGSQISAIVFRLTLV